MGENVGLLVNGLSFGMLIFLLAAGLTLIFGLLRYVNLAHGSIYLLTAYVAIEVTKRSGHLLWGALAAVALSALMGAALYLVFIRGRARLLDDPLSQVLLSFGLIAIAADVAQSQFGGLAASLDTPSFLRGSVAVLGSRLAVYRLFLIGFGVAVAAVLLLVERRSTFGAAVRAGVNDPGMLAAIGRNPERLFLAVFVGGFTLAGIAGVVGAPFLGAAPGVEYTVLLYAVPVVVVGGLGSLAGAFAASLLVGVVDAIGKTHFPQVSLFLLFAFVVAVLAWRPTGLVRNA